MDNNKFSNNKKIQERVKKQMKLAKQYLDRNDKSAFYQEVHKAILGYIEHKLKMNPSTLSRDNISEKLTERGVGIDTTSKLNSLIDDCEMSLYTNLNTEQMNQTYELSLKVLQTIETEIV